MRQARRSARLAEFDYRQAGAYFVTVCALGRAGLFGKIAGGEMRLNKYGEAVHAVWNGLPDHYPHVQLDQFVIMPNHIHEIILLTEDSGPMDSVGAGLGPAPTQRSDKRHGLPEIVRAVKSFSARRINALRRTPGRAVWQRNYFEHVIRNDRDLAAIRQYIYDNPARWADDHDNPLNFRRETRARTKLDSLND